MSPPRQPGVAREVAAAGHMIVNHTWNHYNLGYISAAGVWDEIAQATDAIHAATGERPGMFRAPYGYGRRRCSATARRPG